MAKLKKTTTRASDATEQVFSPAEAALRNASDIVVTLSEKQTVTDVSVSPATRSLGTFDHWRGKPVTEFLTDESVPKLVQRLASLSDADGPAFETVELNHLGGPQSEFPVHYTLQPDRATGGTLMVGRDLRVVAEVQQQLVRAQLALEKEYETHRDFETRYRVLRDSQSDAIAFVDAASGRILDLNPPAATLLGNSIDGLVGLSLNAVFDERQKRPAMEHLLRVASEKEGGSVIAVVGKSSEKLTIHPTLFRSAGDVMVLCRFGTARGDAPVLGDVLSSLNALFQKGSDAIVFTDSRGTIRHANEGFLVLCDVVQVSDLKGKPISAFLSRGSIDQKVLFDAASQTGRVKAFATGLKSTHGGETSIEIAATRLNDREEPYFGLVIRDRSRGEPVPADVNRDGAMHNAMELVGTAPLKELVAATADVVEKMCIETAVKLTDNNRVAAAELLGLSRQSFYVRLRKYGLLKKGED